MIKLNKTPLDGKILRIKYRVNFQIIRNNYLSLIYKKNKKLLKRDQLSASICVFCLIYKHRNNYFL